MKSEFDRSAANAGRRRVLLGLGAIGAALAIPQQAYAAINPEPRNLRFYNLHTDESLDVTYWESGRYVNDALASVNNLMRDFRSGEVYPMDKRLLDFLHLVRTDVASDGVFEIISGYRSPKTNAKLRAKGRGVAKRSFHMKGMAIDVRLRGTRLSALRSVATGLQRGGVGYYQKSNFIHLDVGRARTW
ncbi:MAG: DUF882 domain-containing protein [Gammaproteobacteria bacterium]|nr:DUF882 domain-containing protein [Gammaproteobacteria bacterium]